MFKHCALFLLLAAGVNAQILEETIVTAQKREQNNQATALAVTSLSQPIKYGGSHDLVNIAGFVPGLVANAFNGVNPQFFIRGVGSTATDAGTDGSVVVLVDEVYAGRAGAWGFDLFDVQRVEVLRGAQGTLYGRGAAGGVIHVIHNKPTAEPEGFVDVLYGRFNHVKVATAMGGPLTPRTGSRVVQGRLAMIYQHRDGYVNNRITGTDKLRETQNSAMRLQLFSELSAKASVLVSGDYAKDRWLGWSPRKAIATSSPLRVAGFIVLDDPEKNINRVTLSTDAPSQRESTGLSARLTIDISWAKLTAISGWRSNRYHLLEDISATGLIELEQDESSQHFTQELRLHTITDNGIIWSGGLYYLNEDVDRIDVIDLSAISDVVNAGSPFVIPDNIARYDQQGGTESYAVFTQLEVPVGKQWNMLLGGRYTIDEKVLAVNATGNDPLAFAVLANGPFSASIGDTFKQFTGKASLSYAINPDLLSYISYAQGYKSGGFNGNAATEQGFVTPFNQESADNLEFGIKSTWFKQRLRANVAAFYIDYDDLQVFQIKNNGTQFVSNAAQARISGVEVEIQAAPVDKLTLLFAYTFLDNEYTYFISDVDDNQDGLADDLSGNQLTRSPRHSYSLIVTYQQPLTNACVATAQLEHSYQDDIFITPQNRPLDLIDAYSLWNVSLELMFNQNLVLSAFVNNLTNEQYKLHAFDVDPVVRGLVQSAVFADPRTWGVKVGYRF